MTIKQLRAMMIQNTTVLFETHHERTAQSDRVLGLTLCSPECTTGKKKRKKERKT